MTNQDYQLRYLESTANIKNSISALTDRTPNTNTADSIRVFIQQGRMFLESAATSPIEIRPLMTYYGISAYAKAIVCVKNFCSYETLPTSHGLRDISNQASMLSNLTARIEGNGLFQAFNDAINESEGLNYYLDATLHKHNTPAATSANMSGLTISLKDILSRISRLDGLYEQTFLERANTLPFSFYIDSSDGTPSIRIDASDLYTSKDSLIKIIAEIRDKHPHMQEWRLCSAEIAWGNSLMTFNNEPYDIGLEFNNNVLEYEPTGNRYTANLRSISYNKNNRKDFQNIINFVGGGQINEHPCFVVPYSNNHIAQLSLRFIGVFMLSSLVRYRPNTWIHSLSHLATPNRGHDDHLLALVEQFTRDTVQSFTNATKASFGLSEN